MVHIDMLYTSKCFLLKHGKKNPYDAMLKSGVICLSNMLFACTKGKQNDSFHV